MKFLVKLRFYSKMPKYVGIPKSNLKFKAVSNKELRLNNMIVGRKRITHFVLNENGYLLTFLKKFDSFLTKMNLVLDFDGSDVVVALDQVVQMAHFDKRFANIDICAVKEEDVRLHLTKCAMKDFLANLSVMCGAQIFIKEINFNDKYQRLDNEIGLGLLNTGTHGVILCNVSANDNEFEKLISIIEKIQPVSSLNCDFLNFEWNIELGRTNISKEEFKNITEKGIIFLDEHADFKNYIYNLKGLSNVSIQCKFADDHFSVVSVK